VELLILSLFALVDVACCSDVTEPHELCGLPAQFMRRHEWRGITYRFPGAPAVKIITVKPPVAGALVDSTEQ
jgi:hypothetical protein